ncbi:hypothetical protein DN397_12875 [Bacillus sp. AY1-10]|nr:hypothetical protein DN397_12875 [Bacillus sp. AY1-10]
MKCTPIVKHSLTIGVHFIGIGFSISQKYIIVGFMSKCWRYPMPINLRKQVTLKTIKINFRSIKTQNFHLKGTVKS